MSVTGASVTFHPLHDPTEATVIGIALHVSLSQEEADESELRQRKLRKLQDGSNDVLTSLLCCMGKNAATNVSPP